MKTADRLFTYWRESLLVLFVTLPWLSLLLLGMVWLWQGGYVWIFAVISAVLGLLGWPLLRSVRHRSKEEARRSLRNLAEPAREWNSVERDAWTLVQGIADETDPLSFTEVEPVMAVAQRTIETVARRFHDDDERAWARFSLPEALLLAERMCRDIRREALRNIPGVREVRLNHLLWLHAQGSRYGAVARLAWGLGHSLWRFARAAINPVQAAGNEISSIVLGRTTDVLSLRMRSYLTRLLILEVGRAAVDLYSGRLVLSEEELRNAQQREQEGVAAEPVIPIRIVLGGQVSAGKSSLLNALAQEVRGSVGPVPTTSKPTEYLLDPDGHPTVVLVDTPGLDASHMVTAELMRQAERADLVLWVAAATQAARAIDRRALDELRAKMTAQLERRPPPILVALTHVDQLQPGAEWAPPYDVATPTTAKARSMRAAIDSVASILGFPPDSIVPVAVVPGREPYNLDSLWARIALEMEEAKLVQLDRLRFSQRAFRLKELQQQLGNAGRLIIRGLVKS